MEEALLIASQSKKDRIAGMSNMMSTHIGLYSENLPKISGAQTKASMQSNDNGAYHKKSKSMGRNTGTYNTATNFRSNNRNECLSNDRAMKPGGGKGDTFSDSMHPNVE